MVMSFVEVVLSSIGFLTLIPVSSVEHKHARPAEIGLFELIKVPGMFQTWRLMIAFSSWWSSPVRV